MAIGTGAALLGGAAAGGLSSIAGSLMGSSAQKKASKQAIAAQMAMFEKMQKNLQPYMDAGESAINPLLGLIGANGEDPQAALEKLPGYQFTKTQGLKAVQNSAAARGLGSSGAAYKGAADYATGLADNTFGDQFNRLLGLTTMGANAAAGAGSGAIQTGANVASSYGNLGNAEAAGYLGGAAGINNSVNSGMGMYLTNRLLDGKGY